MSGRIERTEQEFLQWVHRDIEGPMADFRDPHQEWRRLVSELYGTFLLVLVAAGAGMMGQAFPGTISRAAAVVAPALMVMGIILFMGKVSGAHLNPAVSIAFALRRDFPWRRVPGYIVAQLAGATLAALFLQWVVGVSATYGSNHPAESYGAGPAFVMEAVLTLGLVSVIPGDGVRGPEHRHLRGARRGRVHRPRGSVGKPDLRCIDESGPNLRPGSRQSHVHRLLGLRRRPTCRRRDRGRHRVRPAGTGWGRVGLRCGAGDPLHRDRQLGSDLTP